MATNKPQTTYMKTALRLPQELHAQVHASAADSGRSYNAEIIERLKADLPMKQDDPQFKLRIDPELLCRIKEAARTSGRSMNAEIVARLNSTFPAAEAPASGGMVQISAELHAALMGLLKAGA